MKISIRTFVTLSLLVLSVNVQAASKSVKKTHSSSLQTVGTGKKAKSTFGASENLSRDVVFDGSTVNGRYHSAGEAVATVETEKKMNDLIGFRRDFKDRLVVERARLKGQ